MAEHQTYQIPEDAHAQTLSNKQIQAAIRPFNDGGQAIEPKIWNFLDTVGYDIFSQLSPEQIAVISQMPDPHTFSMFVADPAHSLLSGQTRDFQIGTREDIFELSLHLLASLNCRPWEHYEQVLGYKIRGKYDSLVPEFAQWFEAMTIDQRVHFLIWVQHAQRTVSDGQIIHTVERIGLDNFLTLRGQTLTDVLQLILKPQPQYPAQFAQATTQNLPSLSTLSVNSNPVAFTSNTLKTYGKHSPITHDEICENFATLLQRTSTELSTFTRQDVQDAITQPPSDV